MIRAGKLALDLLFPKRCLWCGKVKGFASCPTCEKLARALATNKAIPGTDEGRVGSHLTQVCYGFQYEGVVREAVHRFKFEGQPELADAIVNELQQANLLPLQDGCDILLFIPQTKAEYKEKGYNQSLLLAQAVGKRMGLPVGKDILVKTRETKRQAGLTRTERERNVKGAFKVSAPSAVIGKRVVLVDDVITTGCTLEECAKMLAKAGADNCTALCFAGATRLL